MANLYFDESLAETAFAVGGSLFVGGEEGRHAVRVSRLRVGERTLVGDGRGTIAAGEVESVDRERFTVRIDEVRRAPADGRRLVLAQALAKGDRDERAVEQATEFGVDAILPWQAARSVSRWGDEEKARKGEAKWARIAREASKQSMRPVIPEVLPATDLSGLVARATEAHLLVLHPRGEERLSEWAAPLDDARDAVLVVGPEGGFSEQEIDALAHAGARIVRLGETVLRTSSAGPAGLVALSIALGRW